MTLVLVMRDEIQQRLARGETKRAIASSLGISPRTLGRILHAPDEAPVPAGDDEEEEQPLPDEEEETPDAEPVPAAEPEPLTAAAALEWLEAYAERIADQARTAYAPWQVLQLTQELSLLLVAVVKEVRANAHD